MPVTSAKQSFVPIKLDHQLLQEHCTGCAAITYTGLAPTPDRRDDSVSVCPLSSACA